MTSIFNIINRLKLQYMKSYRIWLLATLVISVTTRYKEITDYWSKQLKDPLNCEVFAGYQQINWFYPGTASGMYFSLFSARGHSIKNQSDKLPIILWLQGGPGSSSQFGAFAEIGPIRIQKGVPKINMNSWNRIAHLLFVDSPLNTGFSFLGERQGKSQINSTSNTTKHLINFLFNLYQEIPSLKNSPFYIAGESFAGHYIPSLAYHIYFNTSFINDTGMIFSGLMIGNGWVDPINQINYYDSYLWSVGIIENKFKEVCIWYQTNSIISIYQKQYQKATDYFDFITNNKTTSQVYMGNISLYNFRNYDGIDRSYATFLNNSKNQVGGQCNFIPSNPSIYAAFGSDITQSHLAELSSVLRNKRVLIYNGQNDVVVNNVGVLQYINSLDWIGIFDWKRTQKSIWTRYGENHGWAKVFGNLWFVQINNAGHMVPIDQPQAALSMLGHFIHNDNEWDQ